MKIIFLSIQIVLLSIICANAQNEISYRIEKSFDRMFYNTNDPTVDVSVYNNDNYEKYADTLYCRVVSDSGRKIYRFRQQFSVSPSDSAMISFSFPLNSGFYRVYIEREDTVILSANIGYEPEMIESRPDSLFSFSQTWDTFVQELKATPIDAEVVKLKKLKTKVRNIFSVKLKSIGGGIVEGYIAVPKKKGIYKTVITCVDKDEAPFMPDGNRGDSVIDLVISPRKGGFNKEYYYRTLCLDVVRAIDYVYRREDVDLKNIFLKGKGRGGAFVMAACALDTRVTAAAVYAPGLTAESATNELKPYDIRNLSGRIKAPLLMGVGLEDTVCMPRQCFELYNPVTSPKQYYIFIEGHNQPLLWDEIAGNFFNRYER